MRKSVVIAILFCAHAFGQLTADQKAFDMQDLAATFAKQYGPYEWKRDYLNFDLMNLDPWLSRVAGTQNDLDFYEVMAEYVAALYDTHSLYLLPSSFSANLGFTVDIFDGKVLIDSINRVLLPAGKYPVSVGDELASIDGTAMQDLIPQYAQYHRYATARPSARFSANSVVNRAQVYNPYAVGVPATSALTFNRAATGDTITLTVPWVKSGSPLLSIDPVPSPTDQASGMARRPRAGSARVGSARVNTVGAGDVAGAAGTKDYLDQLRNAADPVPQGVTGYGGAHPVFNAPPGFVPRLGLRSTDEFLSGTFPAGPYTFGFIRIASYSPNSTSNALAQFQTEMSFFQQNVDGLIVDQMRNPGGDVCYGQSIVSYLMPAPFRPMGFEVRATRDALLNAYAGLSLAQLTGPQARIDQYQLLLTNMEAAYQTNRGHTDAMPLCGPSLTANPAMDVRGNVISYTKPMVFLVDEFSTSGGDAVPAMLQGSGRGLLVGYNTNGAGGTVGDGFDAGPYSEGGVNVTLSMMVREAPVNSVYGPTAYVENVGVQPDVTIDYMTRDNLVNGGVTFLNQVIAVLTQQVQASTGQ